MGYYTRMEGKVKNPEGCLKREYFKRKIKNMGIKS